MTKHDITNKMAEALLHLRLAETFCSSGKALDQIEATVNIIKDVGEACGKQLTKEQEV